MEHDIAFHERFKKIWAHMTFASFGGMIVAVLMVAFGSRTVGVVVFALMFIAFFASIWLFSESYKEARYYEGTDDGD